MNNGTTVLSFEDAKRRAGKSNERSTSRSRSYSSNHTSSIDSDKNSLSYVFDMGFDTRDGAFASYDDLSNPDLGVAADDISNAEEDLGTASKKGVFSVLNDKLDAKKREFKKAKADRAFNKSFGSFDAGGDTSAGPRAALYKTEMGSKQKRAARMQESGRTWGDGINFSLPAISLPDIPKKIMVTLCAAFCIVLFAGMLYTPAQQYYQQMRERDRLSAEYEAIIDRNESLQGLVDNLQSDEGVEDKAHAEFGLIKKGEQAGAVTGFVVDDPSDFKANIAPGSIPAPETWYSGVLDFLFCYSS